MKNHSIFLQQVIPLNHQGTLGLALEPSHLKPFLHKYINVNNDRYTVTKPFTFLVNSQPRINVTINAIINKQGRFFAIARLTDDSLLTVKVFIIDQKRKMAIYKAIGAALSKESKNSLNEDTATSHIESTLMAVPDQISEALYPELHKHIHDSARQNFEYLNNQSLASINEIQHENCHAMQPTRAMRR